MIELKPKYILLPFPYKGSHPGDKGRQFFPEPWILALSQTVETCVMVSISDMPAVKYWKFLGSLLDRAKEKTPKQCIISDTCLRPWQLLGFIC